MPDAGPARDDGPDALDVVPPDDVRRAEGMWWLALVAVIAGVTTGVVGGVFRAALGWLELRRTELLVWAGEAPGVRVVVPLVAAGAAAAVARLLVRWAPEAGGSGVQLVEAQLRGQWGPTSSRVLPVKFAGGLLAMGAGLALGREGPTVQMGSAVGSLASRLGRLDPRTTRTLIASTAGAGLAVAFTAPIGGAVFVFEELARAVRTRLVLATTLAVGSAVAVSTWIVGTRLDFTVGDVGFDGWQLPAFAVLGLLLGVLGVLYNRLVVALLAVVDNLRRVPPEAKAAVVGALVGIIGVASPRLVGGGDIATQEILLGGVPLSALVVIVVVRWFLGPASYSVGTPGGLFAPLLLVGAAGGALLAEVWNMVVPGASLQGPTFAVVGMATFFAAVVRAPVTGVVLVVEMTATTQLAVPMLLASGCALLVTSVMHGPPVYDSLRGRMLQSWHGRQPS